MKRHVHTASVETTALEAARLMSEHGIGFLPVCDAHGRPVGVVTDRDLTLRVCAQGLPADSTPLGEVMTKDPLRCSASSTLDQAESLMLDRKSRRILLVDGKNKLVGLITLADVIHRQDPFQITHFIRALTEKRLRFER